MDRTALAPTVAAEDSAAKALIERYLVRCQQVGIEPIRINDCLRRNPKGEGLLLTTDSISLSGLNATALAAAIEDSDVLRSVEFSNCYINDEGCAALCQAVLGCTSLERVSLSGNHLRDPRPITDLVRQGVALQELMLQWNCLGSQPASFSDFCAAVASSRTLKQVDLRNNKIGSDCVSAVAQLIEGGCLETLDLRWNKLGPTSGAVLLSAVQQNHTIVQLPLTGNDLEYSVLTRIEQHVSRNAIRAEEIAKTRTFQMQHVAERSSLQGERDELRRELAHKEQVMEKERGAADHLRHEISRLQDKLCAKETELVEAKAAAQNAVAEASRENSALEASLKDAEARHKAHMEETEKRHMMALETQLDRVKGLEAELAASRSAGERLQSKLAAAEEQAAALQKKLLRSEEEGAEHYENWKTVKEKLKDAEHRVAMLEERHRLLEKEAMSREAKIEVLEEGKATWFQKELDLQQQVTQLTGSLQQARLDHAAAESHLREMVEKEKREEVAKLERKLSEAMERVKQKECQLQDAREELQRCADRHQKELDEVQLSRKGDLEKLTESEVVRHRLQSQVAQLEALNKNTVYQIEALENRLERVSTEAESATHQHQAEIESLAERFASDRQMLEKKLTQKSARVDSLTTELDEVTAQLRKANDDRQREIERIERRLIDQVRAIFEERHK